MASGANADITLEHMITMSSGLQWAQTSYPPLDSKNDLIKFAQSSSPWYFYLSRSLEDRIHGTVMNYSEASINVVGECIRRSSGIRLDQFADAYLFNVLGISETRGSVMVIMLWQRDSTLKLKWFVIKLLCRDITAATIDISGQDNHK